MEPFCFFESDRIEVITRSGDRLKVPLIPCSLVFEGRTLDGCGYTIESDEIRNWGREQRRELRGRLAGTALRFEAAWMVEPSGWVRFKIRFFGQPEQSWGRLRKAVVLNQELVGMAPEAPVGWREAATPEEAAALADRPTEEGGGVLPPFGYPVFADDLFFGLEHPMGCAETTETSITLFHHPVWDEEGLRLAPLVIGKAREGEAVGDAFLRYVDSIRRPKPERAIVELNTFWTDRFEPETGYSTDLASYERIASEWAERILAGERGLVSHVMLDAGWHKTASIFEPAATSGGPGDEGLAALGCTFEALGFKLGLWFSLNGPIGIDPRWAAGQGFRVSNRGCGAGYGCAGGKLSYLCLTDPAWEEALSGRLEQMIDRIPVSFFKGDWDNDAVEDPAWEGDGASLREAIAEAMIRIYGRMHSRRPDVALRGAWWASPWWFGHVENTHLPNSGDMESADLPSLTQRDAAITCRDAVYHHVMVVCRTPVPYDVICGHEFASSARNPVHDTEASWMNNLAMWVSRGSHYLQLYLAPYGVQEWKAWSVREMLRWFRGHEAVLWKGTSRMVGGDPFRGRVYGYHHSDGEREILTLRNPLARPQALPGLEEFGVESDGWVQIYPFFRRFEGAQSLLASHEVVVLARGMEEAPQGVFIKTQAGWRVPGFAASPEEFHQRADGAVPSLHDLGAVRASVERTPEGRWIFHATLPYYLQSVEIVLQVRTDKPGIGLGLRASVGRYPEEVATSPVPLTICRPGQQIGFAQRRLKAPLHDPHVAIVRIPLGTGGAAHAFVSAEEELPHIEGAWLEGTAWSVEAEDKEVSLPPAPGAPSLALAEIDLSGFSK